MSNLISLHPSRNVEGENNNSSCEACGRMFENSIRLTNLSAMPMQTYNACPFCFSKLDENEVLGEPNDSKVPISNDSNIVFGKSPKSVDVSERIGCPHHFGYLKKRPKNTPIPDACLTCQKMIQCLF